MKRKLKKIAIIAGILFAAVFTLYVLWASWENWTGARAWEEVRTMLEEEVPLELADILAEPVPPKENFFATPLLASLTEFQSENPSNMEEVSTGSAPIYAHPKLRERFLAMRLPDPELGQPNPLPAWQGATAARFGAIRRQLDVEGDKEDAAAVLEWMSAFDAELAEIDAAAKLPAAQIPATLGDSFLDNISMPLPFLPDLMDFQKFQAIRACAALETGDAEQARATLRTMMQMARAALNHPTLIGYLVGVATMDNCLSVIWHGMQRGQWSADDLQWIQQQLSQHDFLEPLENALTVEMVGMQIGAADYLKGISLGESKELVKIVSGTSDGENRQSWAGMLALVAPTGIWDHNKAFGCRVAYEYGILPVRERRIPDSDALLREFRKRNHRTFLASITIPAVSNVAEKGYLTSVALDLARLACAIECHQIETGSYPDSLEALVPKFIDAVPEDLFRAGSPLQYATGVHGDRYRIYSVGINRSDDGGAVEFEDKQRQPPRRDKAEGDWAWGYTFELPENAEGND